MAVRRGSHQSREIIIDQLAGINVSRASSARGKHPPSGTAADIGGVELLTRPVNPAPWRFNQLSSVRRCPRFSENAAHRSLFGDIVLRRTPGDPLGDARLSQVPTARPKALLQKCP